MANNIAPRKEPYSIEAEQSVLGCMLISNVVANELCANMVKDDFYSGVHQKIFETMQSLVKKNQPVDYVTLVSELERESKLNDIGGMNYITTLTNVVPTASNYEHYAEIVLTNSKQRKLLEMGNQIVAKAYDGEEPADIIDFVEKQLTDIATQKKEGLVHIAGAVDAVSQKFEDIAKDPNAITGLKTGFYGLDRALNGGLQKGTLVLLAARPGVGKTSLAMNIVTNCAIESKAVCAVFSLEMPAEQLAQRATCSVAMVDMKKALSGEMSADDWTAFWASRKKLKESNIYVNDSSLITTSQIVNMCRRIKREKGLDLVMIDYVQLMSSSMQGKTPENRQQEISNFTRNLKIAAKELDVPILLLSQLSRAVEKREDHRPMLADLRESGSIEQDADVVMFIYNKDMYSAPDAEKPGIVELNIEKNRSGERASIKLKFMREYTTFLNLTHDADAGSLEKSMPEFNKRPSKEDLKGEKVPEKIVSIDEIDDQKSVFK